MVHFAVTTTMANAHVMADSIPVIGVCFVEDLSDRCLLWSKNGVLPIHEEIISP